MDAAYELVVTVEARSGPRRVRAVLDAALQRIRQDDRRRGPFLLALAQYESMLGERDSAREHLVQMVLAMDPDWYVDRGVLPRLVFFAGGPNTEPGYAIASAKFFDYSELWTSSGAAWWDGGSWLAHSGDGHKFIDWMQDVAADDGAPEPAMAATIWIHAVTSRHNWQALPRNLPAAARFRAVDGLQFPPSPGEDDAKWKRVFEEQRAVAAGAGAPWAKALHAVETRILTKPEEWKAPNGPRAGDMRADPLVIWSLSDEFARRFASVESPRAEALRALAARLVAFDDTESAPK
jgi:hypothetical protein